MTRGDLTAYLAFFARNGPAAMKESAAPPYRIGALDRVFTGELRETARFKSVFYRTKGYREEGEHTISGRGPIFALPKSRGRNCRRPRETARRRPRSCPLADMRTAH